MRLFADGDTFVGMARSCSQLLPATGGKSAIASILWQTSILLIFLLACLRAPAREKDAIQYGAGLIVNVPFSESEVSEAVQEVVQNGIIRGTKEYNKDEYITGATVATSTRVYKEWTEGGKVFYKVRLKALDPQNFKDTNDAGTLAVRYIVQGQDSTHTVLRINAVFVEDFRHVSHASNGSVEGAEYKAIHDHLDSIELMKNQTAEAEREKEARSAKPQLNAVPTSETSSSVPQYPVPPPVKSELPSPSTTEPQSSSQTLEQRVQELRSQVVRRVKSPGAPLKAAPFHTASNLKSLPAGTEVLIVVSTTYWLGVETHEGQHGWMLRDELELVP